jgi:hydrogenase/urease accessory protein HupE
LTFVARMLIAGAWLLLLPSTAHAHLVNSGLGPFYDGALHLLWSPADLLGLAAVVLLAGLQGKRASRWTVVLLPLSWWLAGLVGLRLEALPAMPWLTFPLQIVLGGLVALAPRMPLALTILLVCLYGTLHGLLNGVALGSIGADATSLFGIVVAVLLSALLLGAQVVRITTGWGRIVVRVAGSWVAAVGMLMMGWLYRGTV